MKKFKLPAAFMFTCQISIFAALIFADTWLETTTSDFSSGTSADTQVTSDSVQMAAKSDWWNAAEDWWNPAAGWWDSNWQYRRALTINNTSGAALTDFQVKVENPVYNETGLTGSWHLDGGTTGNIANGTTAGMQDTSGYSHNASASNTNGIGMQWSAGKFDGAIDFDGTDDYTDAGDPSTGYLDFGTNDFTVEAWMKADTLKRGGIVSKFRDGGTWYPGYALIFNADGTVVWYISTSGSGTGKYSTSVLTAGVWYHLILVKKSNTAYFYINAVLDNFLAANYNVDNTYSLWIGATYNTGGNEYFDGLIDDVRIYNRALGIDEIQSRYNARAKLNYGDIRFTEESGTVLPYWMEKDGVFWVKADSIPSGFSTVYMYYGNSSAATADSISSTFIVGDEFNDLTAWTQQSGAWSAANGVVTYPAGTGFLRYNSELGTSNGYIVEAKAKGAGNLYTADGVYIMKSNNPLVQTSGIKTSLNLDTNSYSPIVYIDNAINYGTHDSQPNVWYILKTVVPSSGNPSAYIYDAVRNLLAYKTASAASASASNYFGLAQTEADAMSADWFIIRKYAAQEPVVFIGSEVSPSSQWTYRKAVTINNSGSALSDFQVKIENPVFDETGLVGSWHFDEGNGTSAADMSGCGNIGTLTNGPTWTTNGKADSALSFDGTDDYVSIPDASYWNLSGSWSVALWMKPSDLASTRVFYGRSVDDSLNGGENYLSYQLSSPVGMSWGPVNGEWDTGVTLSTNQWQYVTMVYNAVTSRALCYVDGQLRASVAVSSVGSSSGPLKIADNYNVSHFVGIMDEFRVYNRALSADEILARYTAKTKLNYADIRFINFQGTLPAVELPYWQEKDGTFWVRMDSVPAGLANIFAYYGNSSALTASDGFSVFYFFDDFNDKSFNSSKWDTGTGSSVTETDGVLKVTNNGVTTPTSVLSKTYTVQNAVMEARMKWVSTTGTAHMGFVVRDSVQLLSRGPANNDFYWNDGSQKGTMSYTPPQDTWHFLRASYSGVNGYGYLKNISTGGEILNSVNNFAITSSGKCGLLVWTSTTDWFDDVRVRQYAASEPACSAGSEIISTSQWLYRRQLTVTNNSSSSTLPAGYTTGVDTGLVSMVSSARVQPDADDAVIVYKDPSSGKNYELDRIVDTGKSLVFDGIDDYVTAPDSADWDLTSSDGTMAFWVKPANLGSAVAQGFLNQVNNDQNWCAYIYATGSVGIGRAGINEIVTATGAVCNGIWQHIAFVKSGGTTYIYINGAQAGSGSITYWTNPANPLKIGGHVYSSTNYFYNGSMDEVVFLKRALNTTEIAELYNSGMPKPLPMTSIGTDANLVAYYPFDGDYGDHSTKGNNCTVVNGTYFSAGKVVLVPDLKQGMSFDGTNDYVNAGNGTSTNPANALTITAWINPVSTAGNRGIVSKCKDINNAPYYFLVSDGKLRGTATNPGGSQSDSGLCGTISAGVWQQVAMTYEYVSSGSSIIRLYINSADVGGITNAVGPLQTATNSVWIGAREWAANNDYFSGLIDDVAIYNRVLSVSEISAVYNSGSGTRASIVSTNGLVGYWDLDGSCIDKSGNNNNGLPLNGAFFTTGKLVTTGANRINFRTLTGISASASNATDYFLYYGNTGAFVPPANINNVYLFADDFSGDFDRGWIRSVGTWAVEGGEYSQSDTASGDTNANYPAVLNTPVQCKLKMRWLAAGASGDFGIHIFDSAQTGGGRGNSYLLWANRSASQMIIYESTNDTLTQRGVMSDTPPPQYLMANYTVIYNTSSGALDFKHEETGNTLSWTDTTPLTSGSYISLRTNTAHAHFDDLKISKYISSEPSVSSGAEQLPFQSAGTFTSGVRDTGVSDTAIDSVNWNTTGSGAITMEVRANNSNSGWTDTVPAWESVTNGDTSVGVTGRYIQYRATFTGDGSAAEPVLTDIAIAYTVPIIPPVDSVSCNKLADTWYSTATFTFTNDAGFGDEITVILYVWDNNPAYTFNESESTWDTGALAFDASSDGAWYFHYLPYSITVTPGTAQDMGPFKFDGTAPGTPQLSLPEADASVTESAPSFSWQALSDISGVVYGLQIDNYSNFNLPFVNKNGLSSESYTLSGAGQEILAGNSAYYWRVTATDGAGNFAVSSFRKLTTPSTVPNIVNPATGELFATLQDAINSSNTLSGDVITVADSIAHQESIVISKDIVLENAVLAPSSGYAVTGQGASGSEVLRNCVITKGGISNLALGENLTIFNPNPTEGLVITNSHLVNCMIEYGTDITNSIIENCDLGVTENYFVSASTGDFHINANAVMAIDQGKDLSSEFTDDIEGTKRGKDIYDISNFDAGAWDIGAYEYDPQGVYITSGTGTGDGTGTGTGTGTGSQTSTSLILTAQSALVFSAEVNSTPGLTETLYVYNGGNTDFDWTVDANVDWLVLDLLSGNTSQSSGIGVTADITALTEGTYKGVITITASTASNSPVIIPVTLYIYESTAGTQTSSEVLTIPSDPILLSPSNGTSDLSSAPLIMWESISGATYWLQIGEDMNFSVLTVNKVVETSQYQTFGFAEGIVYFWHVKAVNAAGISEWSDTYWFKIQSSASGDDETPKACFLKRLLTGKLNR